jgi:hypothetical protein
MELIDPDLPYQADRAQSAAINAFDSIVGAEGRMEVTPLADVASRPSTQSNMAPWAEVDRGHEWART